MKLPDSVNTAPPVSNRRNALPTKAKALRPAWPDGHPSDNCGIWFARFKRIGAIDLDTNSYSVPWRLIGESVQVVVLAGRVIIRHAGQVVADHALCDDDDKRIVDRAHFVGVAGARVWCEPPHPSSSRLLPCCARLRIQRLSEEAGDDERDHDVLIATLDRLKLTAIATSSTRC